MPLSTAIKSNIAILILVVVVAYLLNYIVFRPVALTSYGTSTYYLDSIKVSAAFIGIIALFMAILGFMLSWWLITC
ncbi:putative integral membrane protein [Babesia bovis T2Bo]|uniref:putative integral membrane protein n=1 Tax=Babesia bovis T2Bo TaxID=484906 RepID=UPI001C355CAE|nr:putative integral membrane protein [Babesia bovis T2Bo]KAG6440185.1 putative integral membrane protein [Babesia bovis T2Bo]